MESLSEKGSDPLEASRYWLRFEYRRRGSDPFSDRLLMLEQKLVSIEQRPTNILESDDGVWILVAVFKSRLELGIGWRTTNGCQIEFVNNVFDRASRGQRLAKSVVGVS